VGQRGRHKKISIEKYFCARPLDVRSKRLRCFLMKRRPLTGFWQQLQNLGEDLVGHKVLGRRSRKYDAINAEEG
jgi:hypothetical protein